MTDKHHALLKELARQLGKLYDDLDDNRARTVELLLAKLPKPD